MDLSRLPEPLRSRLSEQLDQLPPEVRGRLEQQLAKIPVGQLEVLLQRNSALLQKLAGKMGGPKPGAKPASHKTSTSTVASKTGSHTGQAPRPQSIFDPHDHYNSTIRRGDRESPPLFVMMFLAACIAAALQAFGQLGF
jgi:hypothetical protein